MIDDCAEYGLRSPEFIQAEDFRTIIWRKEKVTNLDEKVTEQGEKVTKLDEKVTEQGEKVSEQDGKSVRAEKKSDRVRLTAKHLQERLQPQIYHCTRRLRE